MSRSEGADLPFATILAVVLAFAFASSIAAGYLAHSWLGEPVPTAASPWSEWLALMWWKTTVAARFWGWVFGKLPTVLAVCAGIAVVSWLLRRVAAR